MNIPSTRSDRSRYSSSARRDCCSDIETCSGASDSRKSRPQGIFATRPFFFGLVHAAFPTHISLGFVAPRVKHALRPLLLLVWSWVQCSSTTREKCYKREPRLAPFFLSFVLFCPLSVCQSPSVASVQYLFSDGDSYISSSHPLNTHSHSVAPSTR